MTAYRITTSTGAVVDDPSADEIAALVAEVGRSGNGAFVILEWPADPSGQTYLHALGPDPVWLVEIRAGSADRHYRAVDVDTASVIELFASWIAGTTDWNALPWQHLPRAHWWQRHSRSGYLAASV